MKKRHAGHLRTLNGVSSLRLEPQRSALAWLLLLTVAAGCVSGCAGQTVDIHPTHTPASTPLPPPTATESVRLVEPEPTMVPAPSVGGLELIGYLGRAQASALALQDGLAYVGSGIQLAAVDLSDAGNARRLDYVVFPGPVIDVAVSGDVVYVVTGGSQGLHVVDASDPASLRVLQTLYAGTLTDAAVVAGSYAYVTNGEFHVLDIADPSSPKEVGSIHFAGEIPPVSGKVEAVVGSHAYTVYQGSSTMSGGLRVLDVSDPSAPVQVGTLGLVGWSYHLVVDGDRAYLLSGYGSSHLTVVDITRPSRPVELALDPATPWLGWSLATLDGRLLLGAPGPAEGPDEVLVLDVADPMRPRVLGRFEGIPRSPAEIAILGQRAYIAAGDGLVILDLADPGTPTVDGTYRPEALPLPDESVSVRDRYAYVAAGEAGLQIVDISQPANPRVVASIRTGGHAWAVALGGSHAYVADEYNGLRIIDVSDPQEPVEVGFYDVPGLHDFFHGVALEGHHVYVADGGLMDTGLRIVDVTDPSAPVELSTLPLSAQSDRIPPPRVEDVAVACDGNRCTAYLAAGTGGLRVVDVSNPAAPIEVSSYDTPGLADNLVAVGSTVYLSDGDLRILDASNPWDVKEVGFFDAPDSAGTLHVAVQGHYAYLSGDGLRILDVSDPGAPEQVAAHPLPAGQLAVSGETILVAGDGLFILRSSLSTR